MHHERCILLSPNQWHEDNIAYCLELIKRNIFHSDVINSSLVIEVWTLSWRDSFHNVRTCYNVSNLFISKPIIPTQKTGETVLTSIYMYIYSTLLKYGHVTFFVNIRLLYFACSFLIASRSFHAKYWTCRLLNFISSLQNTWSGCLLQYKNAPISIHEPTAWPLVILIVCGTETPGCVILQCSLVHLKETQQFRLLQTNRTGSMQLTYVIPTQHGMTEIRKQIGGAISQWWAWLDEMSLPLLLCPVLS